MTQSIALIKASNGVGNASTATVQNLRSSGATSIIVDTVSDWPTNFCATMGTPHTFVDPITAETITVISETSAVDFTGHINTGHIEIDAIAPGYTDAGSSVGDIVIVRPTTQWADNVWAVLDKSLNDDGSPKTTSLNPPGIIAPFAGSSAPTDWLLCDGSAVSRTTYANLYTAISTTFGSGDGSTTFNVPDLRGRTPVGVGSNTWKFTFASTDVNTSTDQIAVTANSELITGRKIQLTTTGTLPTGLSLATDYYIIVIDTTHIKLATSLANSVAGTNIDITGAGSGTNTGTHTGTARTLAEHGGEQIHASTINEMPSHTHQVKSAFTAVPTTSPTANVWNGNSGSSFNVASDPTGGSSAHNIMQPYLSLNYIIKT